jgi:hypothetical protein
MHVDGNTPVRLGIARQSGGAARLVKGPDAALPTAMEFPPRVASGTYPRAVVKVMPVLSEALDPGPADFEFGAVFRVDKTSAGRRNDDGDNVFQRGLYSDGSIYKLEVDKHYPACLIKGADGEVIVRSRAKIKFDVWYRAMCNRTSTEVSITVSRIGETAAPVTTVVAGASGNLYFRPSLPAAIGGKLNRHGRIVENDTDQFNGAVAEVTIAISAQRSCCRPVDAD